MPRKNRKERRDADREEWGEEFGRRMQQFGEEFGARMEKFGEEFSKHMEEKGNRRDRREQRREYYEHRMHWFDGFSFIGPLVGAIVGIIVLAIGIGLLNLINITINSGFILGISKFFSANLQWFFLAFLLFRYGDYVTRRFPQSWGFLRPVVIAAKALFAVWIILGIFGAF
jgi:hypothetical protein